ncbi:b-block-binding subunit of tfiiic protein [Cystoisospora suis]|uniref:B-block-binding subunit of tfiiic protein n=1 Tax=Cystoisospora suis TaxID=483139 RepID=A0A2C6LFV9_9APIC|nr:b-block-binding subunit of tfiiic protein [Cystoisospora suis]
MEDELLALVIDKLSLEGEDGASFPDLLALLARSTRYRGLSVEDAGFQAALWRALYCSPVICFSVVESPSELLAGHNGPDVEEADGAAASLRRPWRHPLVPPELPGSSSALNSEREGGEEAPDLGIGSEPCGREQGVLAEVQCVRQDEGRHGTDNDGARLRKGKAALRDAKNASESSLLDVWRVSVVASVRLNSLGLPYSPMLTSSEADLKMREMPMMLLQAIAKRRFAGQWQYQLAVDLNIQPKMVFHHLKALYKEGLIMHIQLPLPASLRPSHQRGSNLTMSALLWHWRFFDLSCMPPEIQGMVSLHHLQPLQQQVLEMLREAPSQAILESEIHEFCLSAFTSSERSALLSLSARQFNRLYHKLRGELMKTGHVRRLKAWCPQTHKFEKCLCLSPHAAPSPAVKLCKTKGEAPLSGSPAEGVGGYLAETAHGNDEPTTTRGPNSLWSAGVKREGQGSSSDGAPSLQKNGSLGGAGPGPGVSSDGHNTNAQAEADDGALCGARSRMLARELPLADQIVMLLEARGVSGLLSVQVARYIGTDNKRAGKIFAELERRKAVWKVAERRGRCFMYRYFAASAKALSPLAFPASCSTTVLDGGRDPGPPGRISIGAVSSVSETPQSSVAPAGGQEMDRGNFEVGGQKRGGGRGGRGGRRGGARFVKAGSSGGTQRVAHSHAETAAGASSLHVASPVGTEERSPSVCDTNPTDEGRCLANEEVPEATVSPDAGEASRPGRDPDSSPAPTGDMTRGRGRGGRRGQTRGLARGRGGRGKKVELQAIAVADRGNLSEATFGRDSNSQLDPAICYGGSAGALKQEQLSGDADARDEPRTGNAAFLPTLGQGTCTPLPSSTLSVVCSHSPCVEGESRDLSSAPPGSPQAEAGLPQSDTSFSGAARSLGLGKNQLKMLRTPQFEQRLRLFIEHLRSVGCCTIPVVSKFLAKAEGSVNGPDRKTVQRMAAVAMQQDSRVAVGGAEKGEAQAASLRTSTAGPGPPKRAKRSGAEVVFYYWTETFNEEQARTRIAEMITERRVQGCRLAVQRNEQLLNGLLAREKTSTVGVKTKEEGVQKQKALREEIAKFQKMEEKSLNSTSRGGMPPTMQPEQVQVSAALQVAKLSCPRMRDGASYGGSKLHFSQKTLGMYGFLFPVMIRIKCLHQFLLQLVAAQPRQGSQDSVIQGLTVSSMLKKMPLETFLRTIGCGYPLKFLDKQLSASDAPPLLLEQLPRPVFDVLVLSSRQLQLKRQRQQPPVLPLIGNNKRSAPAALRRLLSVLARMGLVDVVRPPEDAGAEISSTGSIVPLANSLPATSHSRETVSGKHQLERGGEADGGRIGEVTPSSGACSWAVREVVTLFSFARDKVNAPPPVGTFHLTDSGGFERYWAVLQSEVARWLHFNAVPLTAAASTFPPPKSERATRENTAFSGLAQPPRTQGDYENRAGAAVDSGPDAEGEHRRGRQLRPRAPLPDNFRVAEAFSKRNWKGQVLLTPYLRAELEAFSRAIVQRYGEAGGNELERLVFSPHSPEIRRLSARLQIPTDAIIRYLMRLFEIRGGVGNTSQGLSYSLPASRRRNRSMSPHKNDDGSAEEDITRLKSSDRKRGSGSAGPQDKDTGNFSEAEEGRRTQHAVIGQRLLLLHRTRDVRYRCHLCGCLYSLTRSLKLHYENVHKVQLPADSDAYVLPWERRRRNEKLQQAQQQRHIAVAFRRRRRRAPTGILTGRRTDELHELEAFRGRTSTKVEDNYENNEVLHPPDSPSEEDEEEQATKKRKVADSGELAAHMPSRTVQRLIRNMRKEDEFVFFAATVVAERLFVAARWLDAAPLPHAQCGRHIALSHQASTSSSFSSAFSAEATYRSLLHAKATSSSMTADSSPLSEPQFRDISGLPKRSWYSLSSSRSAGRLSLPEGPSASAGFPSPSGSDFSIDEPAFAAAKSGVFGPDGRTLPGLDHPIWTIIAALCSPFLDGAACRHIFSFMTLRRANNVRIFNNCRRVGGYELRDLVSTCRVPSLLDSRNYSGDDSLVCPSKGPEGVITRATPLFDCCAGDAPAVEHQAAVLLAHTPSWNPPEMPSRTSLASRPLNNSRVLLARNALKMMLLTPLTHYRPYSALDAAKELREAEWKGIWSQWARRGWVVQAKQPLPHHTVPQSKLGTATIGVKEPAPSMADGTEERAVGGTPAGSTAATRKAPIQCLLEAKCRRPYCLSNGARAALCGKLRTFRSLSARLQEIVSQARSRTLLLTGVRSSLGNGSEQAKSDAQQLGETLDTAEEEETVVKSSAVERSGIDAGPDRSAVAGLSWREINKASLGISPAGALLLLEQMASGESYFLPKWVGAQAARQAFGAGRDDEDPVAKYFETYGRRQLRATERLTDAGSTDLCRGGADDGAVPPLKQEECSLRESKQVESITARNVSESPGEFDKQLLEPDDGSDDEDLDASLLRLLESADNRDPTVSGVSLPATTDDSLLFLGGDLDEGEDENDLLREGGSPAALESGIPGSAGAGARSIEGGISTHILKHTPKVPQFGGLIHCVSSCEIDHMSGSCRETRVDPYEGATDPRQKAGEYFEDAPLKTRTAGELTGSRGGFDGLFSLRERQRIVPYWQGASSGVSSCPFVSHSCSCDGLVMSHDSSSQERETTNCVGGAAREYFPAHALPTLVPVPFSCTSRLHFPVLSPSSTKLPLSAGYHLVDGFLGAAGEQDPLDPALFPPAFAGGVAVFAAWAASALCVDRRLPVLPAGQWNISTGTAAGHGGTIVPQAGAGGFPVCLPEFAEDVRWGWWRDAATTLPPHASEPYLNSLFTPLTNSSTDTGRLAASTDSNVLEGEEVPLVVPASRDTAACNTIADMGGGICSHACHELGEAGRPEGASPANSGRSSAEGEDCLSLVRVTPLRCQGSGGFLEKDKWDTALRFSLPSGERDRVNAFFGESFRNLKSAETKQDRNKLDSASTPSPSDWGVRAFTRVCLTILRKGLLLPVLPNLVLEGQRILLEVLEGSTTVHHSHSGDELGSEEPQPKSGAPDRHLKEKLPTCSGKLHLNDTPNTPVEVPARCCTEPSGSRLAIRAYRLLASICSVLLSQAAAARADGVAVRVAFDLYCNRVTGGSPSDGTTCVRRAQPTKFSPNVNTGVRAAAGAEERLLSERRQRCDAGITQIARDFVNDFQEAVHGGELLSGQEPRFDGAGVLRARTGCTVRGGAVSHCSEASPVAARKGDSINEVAVSGGATEARNGQVEEMVGASLCAIFQLALSVLTQLRLVVLVPGGADWRMVSVQEAAPRYCVRRLSIVTDHLSKLSCPPSDEHSFRDPVPAETARLPVISDYEDDGEELENRSRKTPPDTSPGTNVDLSGDSSTRLMSARMDRRAEGEVWRPYLPARDPVGNREPPSGVPPVIWAVWGHGDILSSEAVRNRRTTRRGNVPQERSSPEETKRQVGEGGKCDAVSPEEGDKEEPSIQAFCTERWKQLPESLPARGSGATTVSITPCVYRLAQSFIAAVNSEQQSEGKTPGGELCLAAQGTEGTTLDSKRLPFLSAPTWRARPAAPPSLQDREAPGTWSQAVADNEKEEQRAAEGIWALPRNMRPIVAWLRLDGSLNSALVQILSLRCWSVLQTKPGSGAREVQETLALLDLADVSFLLQALVMAGVLRSRSLLPLSRRRLSATAERWAGFRVAIAADAKDVLEEPHDRQSESKKKQVCATGGAETALPRPFLCTSGGLLSSTDQGLPSTRGHIPGGERELPQRKRRVQWDLINGHERKGEPAADNLHKRPRLTVSPGKTNPADSTFETPSNAVLDPNEMSRSKADVLPAGLAADSEDTLKRVVSRARALALEAVTLYFPEKAEAVLPIYSEVLLPRGLHERE